MGSILLWLLLENLSVAFLIVLELVNFAAINFGSDIDE